MKDCFKPHRNPADESHLKEIIEKIQSQMHEPESRSIIEALLKEAEAYIKSPNRKPFPRRIFYPLCSISKRQSQPNSSPIPYGQITGWIFTGSFSH